MKLLRYWSFRRWSMLFLLNWLWNWKWRSAHFFYIQLWNLKFLRDFGFLDSTSIILIWNFNLTFINFLCWNILSRSNLGVVNLKIYDPSRAWEVRDFFLFAELSLRVFILNCNIILMRIFINNLPWIYEISLIFNHCWRNFYFFLFSSLELHHYWWIGRITKIDLLGICLPKVFKFFISPFPLLQKGLPSFIHIFKIIKQVS